MEQEAVRGVADRRLARRPHVVGVEPSRARASRRPAGRTRPMRPTWRRRRGTGCVRGPSAPACRARSRGAALRPRRGRPNGPPGVSRRAVVADVVAALVRAAAERSRRRVRPTSRTSATSRLTARPPRGPGSPRHSRPPSPRRRASGRRTSRNRACVTEPEVEPGVLRREVAASRPAAHGAASGRRRASRSPRRRAAHPRARPRASPLAPRFWSRTSGPPSGRTATSRSPSLS